MLARDEEMIDYFNLGVTERASCLCRINTTTSEKFIFSWQPMKKEMPAKDANFLRRYFVPQSLVNGRV